MVVRRVMSCSPWHPATAATSKKKYHVKLMVARIEGMVLPACGARRLAGVEISWDGSRRKPRRFSYFGGTRRLKDDKKLSGEKVVERDGTAEWGEGEENEFMHVCCFRCPFSGSGDVKPFEPWEVSFSILYGSESENHKEKALEKIGTIAVNLAEWVSSSKVKESEFQVQRKRLPITLNKDGLSCNAMLYVEFSFVELISSQTIARAPEARDDSRIEFRRQEELAESYRKVSSLNDEEDSSDTCDSCNVTEVTSSSSSSSSSADSSPQLQLRLPPKRTLFSSKKGSKNATESITATQASSPGYFKDCQDGKWEQREIVSRDKQAMLKAQTFFASIDQCDESADGESACTVLVAVLADALHDNKLNDPIRMEFDKLIREGSSEWRKLCEDESYAEKFPNKHFDLETILEAKVRPISVNQNKSFIGFFQPESFESLHGAMSFDGIWEEMTKDANQGDPKVYIVSWNDHFFVLKLEQNAYQIIDTLGERLFEGCREAYMLEFNDSTEMYKLSENANEGDEIELVSKGTECCREFIKRFLAAIPLMEELGLEEKRKMSGTTSAALHQRLQIEFHLTEKSNQIEVLRTPLR